MAFKPDFNPSVVISVKKSRSSTSNSVFLLLSALKYLFKQVISNARHNIVNIYKSSWNTMNAAYIDVGKYISECMSNIVNVIARIKIVQLNIYIETNIR